MGDSKMSINQGIITEVGNTISTSAQVFDTKILGTQLIITTGLYI